MVLLMFEPKAWSESKQVHLMAQGVLLSFCNAKPMFVLDTNLVTDSTFAIGRESTDRGKTKGNHQQIISDYANLFGL